MNIVTTDRGDQATERDPADVLPLTPAAFAITLVLAERARHGYAIMQEVGRLTDGELTLGPGTLYRSLQRLRVDGVIEELVDHSDPSSEDERRRYYRLTSFGRRLARAESARLARLVDAAAARGLLARMPTRRRERRDGR